MLTFVQQRGNDFGDCAVASMATVANVKYEEALAAASQVSETVLKEGLTTAEIRKSLAKLGKKATRHAPGSYDPLTRTGLLCVYKGRTERTSTEAHVVVLWNGRVIDAGDRGWMSVGEFEQGTGWKSGTLLTLD